MRFAWRGRTLHVVLSRRFSSSIFWTEASLAGSSGERKSSTPSKPQVLILTNKGASLSSTRVVQTMVFTPYFIAAAPAQYSRGISAPDGPKLNGTRSRVSIGIPKVRLVVIGAPKV